MTINHYNRPVESAAMSPIDQVSTDEELAQIRDALAGLRFGEVSIVVQDGVIVQIVRTEKRRLRTPKK